MKDSGFGSFLAGVVIGGLVGAAIGLLLAPDTGERMREQVADFVDEVRVIPPVSRAIDAVNTNSGSCGTGTFTTTYAYDSQRRVVQITNGTSAATTYTAWDESGRPTAGTTGGNGLSLVYNDAARTVTTTQSGSQPSVSTLSFDANGAQTQIVLVQSGITTTTSFTNTATATVCK